MKRTAFLILLAGLSVGQAGFCSQAAPISETAQEVSASGWDYRAEENTWYYYGKKGERLTGRQEIDGSTYFFDETGKMLTGWVTCGEGRDEEAEAYEGPMDEDVYYCETTGVMAAGRWVQTLAPDAEEEGETEGSWYYFDSKGRPYRNAKVTYEGKEYIFDQEGKRLTGWVYEQSQKNGVDSLQYIGVDEETEEAQSGDLNGDGSYAERMFAHNPQYYLYCDASSGEVVKEAWVDAIPPGKGEGEDARSFYLDKNGHLVTQYRYGFTREESDWNHYPEELNRAVVADRIWPRKIENEQIGTYRYKGAPGTGTEDDGFEGFIMEAADGRYYLCENNGARLDGLFLIRKKEESSLRKFPNGIYDFADKAAMVFGEETKQNPESGQTYYYYFAEDSKGDKVKGKGVTGVYGGKLYYQGLAVGANGEDPYELVYVPEIADRNPQATGLFLVDREGNVKKGTKQRQNSKGIVTGGTKYKMENGYTYRVCLPANGKGEYGYEIDRIDRDLDIDHDPGVRLGADDASYLYLKEVEE